MKAALSIARREIFAYFASPTAYVVLLAWVYVTGLSFYLLLSWAASAPSVGGSDNPLTLFFGGTILFWLPVLVFAPVMTMRLFAAERASGTLELLLTAPIGEWGIVLGKFLAAMFFWITLWIPTLFFVFVVGSYGDIDAGAVASSYLGVFGIGLFYMSWGMLMSALAPTQMTAAIACFLVHGVFFVAGIGQFVYQGEGREVLAYISVWSHMTDFAQGIVDTRYLLFQLTMSALAFALTTQVLAWRRLRG